MKRLFDKIPEEFFSPLSRKYKAIYAYALITLYHMLKLYKHDIRKNDLVGSIRSQGEDILNLFSIDSDRLDDKTEEEKVSLDSFVVEEGALINTKINYIVRKLAKCGWFIIAKDPKTHIDYIYVPAYSIQFLKLLDELTSDLNSYLPLVHQTYAELKMEDDKEDDYMYRSLLNAKMNSDTLEMSVTLLRQQICVFGNRLTSVTDPNVALKQHFDEYRTDIAEKYYHPMKTYDSLGLYAQPTISILKKWLKSERIISLIVKEAKAEPVNRGKDIAALNTEIIKLINNIIDIFSRLSISFNEIDTANANYTESVQKKINYLSATDKTVKGKIDRIIIAIANEIKSNPAMKYEDMPILSKGSDAIALFRQGYLDSQSMPMPMRKGKPIEFTPLPLDDAPLDDEIAELISDAFDKDIDRFSDDTVSAFMEKNMEGKDSVTTKDFVLDDFDSLVLLILGTLKSMLGLIPYKATKINERIEHAGYYMPEYEFVRVKGAKR